MLRSQPNPQSEKDPCLTPKHTEIMMKSDVLYDPAASPAQQCRSPEHPCDTSTCSTGSTEESVQPGDVSIGGGLAKKVGKGRWTFPCYLTTVQMGRPEVADHLNKPHPLELNEQSSGVTGSWAGTLSGRVFCCTTSITSIHKGTKKVCFTRITGPS